MYALKELVEIHFINNEEHQGLFVSWYTRSTPKAKEALLNSKVTLDTFKELIQKYQLYTSGLRALGTWMTILIKEVSNDISEWAQTEMSTPYTPDDYIDVDQFLEFLEQYLRSKNGKSLTL